MVQKSTSASRTNIMSDSINVKIITYNFHAHNMLVSETILVQGFEVMTHEPLWNHIDQCFNLPPGTCPNIHVGRETACIIRGRGMTQNFKKWAHAFLAESKQSLRIARNQWKSIKLVAMKEAMWSAFCLGDPSKIAVFLLVSLQNTRGTHLQRDAPNFSQQRGSRSPACPGFMVFMSMPCMPLAYTRLPAWRDRETTRTPVGDQLNGIARVGVHLETSPISRAGACCTHLCCIRTLECGRAGRRAVDSHERFCQEEAW